MTALVTGLNGTVAPVLAEVLRAVGHSVVAWDRSAVPIDNPDTARAFIRETRPDLFFHLATGSPDWAELIAGICAEERIRFLFTSSVSVFSAKQRGPFSVDDLPEPADDYGRYKRECEQRVRAANPDACIVRLGWQIGTTLTGNHMVAFLERTNQRDGHVDASANFFPACSFLADTAERLVDIVRDCPEGLYHLDGNPGFSFHEIAAALNRRWDNRWVVQSTDQPNQNNLLVDDRVQPVPITARLDNATI